MKFSIISFLQLIIFSFSRNKTNRHHPFLCSVDITTFLGIFNDEFDTEARKSRSCKIGT